VIRLDGIARAFGTFSLGEISLEIPQGQYWVLLGPSGAGKTLLLHLLAGLSRPDRGHLYLDERDLTEAPPEQRDIGLVFQQGALFPHLSVLGNIGYGLTARRVAVAERRRRVDELVEALGLAPLLERPVATLSGGEAQRVALARALAPRPQALLLDEPLGPIDFHARAELQEVLARVHRDFGLTCLHVTHSREEARALADGCAVIVGGKIVQSGALDEVLARPRCHFVARLLDAEEAGAEKPSCAEGCLKPGGRCDAVADDR